MHYHVIFDISQTEFPRSEWLWAVVFGIFCVGFAVIFWRMRRRGPIQVLGMVFALALSPTMFLGVHHSYRYYLDVKTGLQESQCAIAEGTVTQFQNLPSSKRTGTGESFVVNGIQFRYRESSAQVGFHQTDLIHDGMQVRIYYFGKNDPIDKDIARLEIAE